MLRRQSFRKAPFSPVQKTTREIKCPRRHENGVCRKSHSGERFRETPFLVTENAVYVWTLTQNGYKKCVFKNIRINVDGASFLKCNGVSVVKVYITETFPYRFLRTVFKLLSSRKSTGNDLWKIANPSFFIVVKKICKKSAKNLLKW